MSKNGEHGTGCRKVQCRHLRIELSRHEIDTYRVGPKITSQCASRHQLHVHKKSVSYQNSAYGPAVVCRLRTTMVKQRDHGVNHGKSETTFRD